MITETGFPNILGKLSGILASIVGVAMNAISTTSKLKFLSHNGLLFLLLALLPVCQMTKWIVANELDGSVLALAVHHHRLDAVGTNDCDRSPCTQAW